MGITIKRTINILGGVHGEFRDSKRFLINFHIKMKEGK
jgi:hypothetical protein